MLRYYNDISEERMEEKKEQLHKDHRSRLRKRYEENGLDSFEDHNVLELLLFYAIPRRDTNPAAHRLISKFGSLSGVFSASVEELQTAPNISRLSAKRADAVCSMRFPNDRLPKGKESENILFIGFRESRGRPHAFLRLTARCF